MTTLNKEVIKRLASGKGVRAIAVENFLSTCGGNTHLEAHMNLEADARAYGWNDATYAAISKGLSMMRSS